MILVDRKRIRSDARKEGITKVDIEERMLDTEKEKMRLIDIEKIDSELWWKSCSIFF